MGSFAQLRESLNDEASLEAFERIMELFRLWKGPEDIELGLEYAREHLEPWPENYRHGALERYWPGCPEQEPEAGFTLLRSLEASQAFLADPTYEYHLRAEAFCSFVASPHLAHLGALALSSNAMGAEGARYLAESPHLSGLEVLKLSGNGLDAEAAKALAPSTALSGVRSLYLDSNALDDAAIRSLTASADWRGLRILELQRNQIGAMGAAALAQCRHLSGLRVLHLSFNPIGDEGAVALAESPFLRDLRELHLHRCGIGDEGMRALARSPICAQLRSLDLSANAGSDEAIVLLTQSPRMPRLHTLKLNDNGLGPPSAAALAQSPQLSELRTLGLIAQYDTNQIGAEGCLALAFSPHLPANIRRRYLKELGRENLQRECQLRGLDPQRESADLIDDLLYPGIDREALANDPEVRELLMRRLASLSSEEEPG